MLSRALWLLVAFSLGAMPAIPANAQTTQNAPAVDRETVVVSTANTFRGSFSLFLTQERDLLWNAHSWYWR